MENFIDLSHICGQTATETTVQLFNSSRPIEKDENGKYILLAVRPYKSGVIVKKSYFNQLNS